MLKYDILAISMSNLAELGPIFHPLGHMFPVRLIMSGVLHGCSAESAPLLLSLGSMQCVFVLSLSETECHVVLGWWSRVDRFIQFPS